MRRGKSLLITSTVGAVLALLTSSVVASEIGVCPPYSKTFGPGVPEEQIAAFIEELNARPTGGTLVLEPGDYGGLRWGPYTITGVICVKSSSSDLSADRLGGRFLVESGGILSIRRVGVERVELASGALLFAENFDFFIDDNDHSLTVESGAMAYLTEVSLAGVLNRGKLFFSRGRIANGNVNGAGFGLGIGLVNEGYASLANVVVTRNGYEDLFHADALGILNEVGGTMVLNHVTITRNNACAGGTGVCGGGGISNLGGYLEIGRSTIGSNEYGPECEGTFSDLGYNVIGDLGDCVIEDHQATTIEADPGFLPNSPELAPGSPAIDLIPLDLCPETDALGRPRTDGNGDGIVACDAGALEFAGTGIVVKSPPFARDYGLVDLSTDSALYVVFMSSAALDPATIDAYSVVLGETGAVPRASNLVDRNGDGVLDLRLRYKLKDVPLVCGEQTLTVSAVTTEGETVSGLLKLEVTGCPF